VNDTGTHESNRFTVAVDNELTHRIASARLAESLLLVADKDEEEKEFHLPQLGVSIKESMAASLQTETGMHQRDLEYIKRMTELREERLIRRGFTFFILPSMVLGLLGCFFPSLYVVLPIHETDICLCSFLEVSGTDTFNE